MTGLALRGELAALPSRMAKLPVVRGYPVPWFVEWIEGVPDFRIMDGRKLVRAVREKLCWVCGQPLGSYMAFTIGPMCAVNRISSEPPSHRDCATFSARSCPFLSRPHMRRRTNDMPEEATKPGGMMLERNPGVTVVWITKHYSVISQRGATPLFRIGDAREVLAFAHGLPATDAELRESIVTGLPALVAAAEPEGPHAMRELARDLRTACQVLQLPPIPLLPPSSLGDAHAAPDPA